MEISKIQERIISPSASLLDAMKQMDEVKVKILLVFSGEHFEGLITIGDIQRAIIKNIALKEPVSRILNKDKIYGYQSGGDHPREDASDAGRGDANFG